MPSVVVWSILLVSVWGEEKVMTIYDAGPLAAGPLCGLLTWAGPSAEMCVGDLCCINFGGFCRGFSWRIFLGTFSHKNEEKKSGEKIREKIRWLKNKNPRKIRSAKNRP